MEVSFITSLQQQTFLASTYFAKFWLTNLVSKCTVNIALVKQVSINMFQLFFPFSCSKWQTSHKCSHSLQKHHGVSLQRTVTVYICRKTEPKKKLLDNHIHINQ